MKQAVRNERNWTQKKVKGGLVLEGASALVRPLIPEEVAGDWGSLSHHRARAWTKVVLATASLPARRDARALEEGNGVLRLRWFLLVCFWHPTNITMNVRGQKV